LLREEFSVVRGSGRVNAYTGKVAVLDPEDAKGTVPAMDPSNWGPVR
jgi:hypothetical protein